MLSTDEKPVTGTRAQRRPARTALPRHLAMAVCLAALLLQGCAGTAPPKIAAKTKPDAVRPKAPAVNTISRLYAQHESWRGTPYRFGGESRSGIDCSALIQQTFRDQFSLDLPRTTAALVEIGEPVAKDQLSAGDLVFFRTGRRTRHAGIYIEGGRFLHASRKKGVIISHLDNPYWSRHYWTARRPLGDGES